MSHPLDPSIVHSDLSGTEVIAPRPAGSSRRSFLGRGVAAGAAAAIFAGPKVSNAATSTSNGPFPSYYTGSTKSKFQGIQVDEFEHVNLLTAVIKSLGGTPRPLPTFTGITNLTPAQFLSLSVTFENTGVHAYLGALPYISNAEIAIASAEIALVEAYHSGFLNTLANVSLVPGAIPLAQPYTLQQVLTGIAPFVVNLNDGGAFPPTFSAAPSAANDISILNFALLLEMLEAEFYYFNVPVLFPN